MAMPSTVPGNAAVSLVDSKIILENLCAFSGQSVVSALCWFQPARERHRSRMEGTNGHKVRRESASAREENAEGEML